MSLPVMRGNISGSTEVPLAIAIAIAPGDPAGAFFSEPEQNRPAGPLNWGVPCAKPASSTLQEPWCN